MRHDLHRKEAGEGSVHCGVLGHREGGGRRMAPQTRREVLV
jgi:hypothetical protein